MFFQAWFCATDHFDPWSASKTLESALTWGKGNRPTKLALSHY